MKLKYKKVILLTTMSTMAIGMLTLSISSQRANSTTAVEGNVEAGSKQELSLLSSADIDTDLNASTLKENVVLTPIPTPTPTPVPSPTPFPVYDLEVDAYPEINTLINDYYAAKSLCDVKTLKKLVSDSSTVDTKEHLQKEAELIEDYRNIKCYTKKSNEEGSYIVYVYWEIKFTTINTLMPGLDKFYVSEDEDGKLKIFFGEKDDAISEYYAARNDDKDVKKLIKTTNDKSNKAKAADEDLQELMDFINSAISSNTETDSDSSKK